MTGDPAAECARLLARAARETSYVAMDNATLAAYLQGAVGALARALTTEPFSTAPAYALGADLVANHFTGPEMSGRLVKVLGGRLLGDLDLDEEPYRERLSALLGAVVTAYARSLRARALDDQEDILRAALGASAAAERALRESEDRRRHEARRDPLTGLPNRLGLTERLEAALRGTDRRVGLCVLDLDRFHALNDTLGPLAADSLLAAVGERLAEHAGGHLVARLGGDEFAVLVVGTTGPDDLVGIADKLLATLERTPVLVGPTPLTVSASAGLVERPAAGMDPDELLRAADIALTWAKADGRGRWRLFEQDRNAADIARWTLAAELPGALRDGQLVVHYQPMISLADGRLHGVEALVRWDHPLHGMLPPGLFVPSAEETGLVVPLGSQVLEAACAEAARWAELTADPPLISVNVAERQLRTPGLVEDVLAVCARTGLPPARLQLEVTENAVLEPDDDALAVLQALADAGVRIAIDDFGTGRANHSFLRRLPLHELKLAAEFVEHVGGPDGDPIDRHLAASLIQLGHTLGLTITAEGVETGAQADWLREAHCDTVQGWHYSAAMPATDLRRALLSSASPEWTLSG
jgi:diguanylate cyclase